MKKQILTFCLIIIAVKSSFCITITTQSQIDNFSINYPDSINIDEIYIDGADIDNLLGLIQIERIDDLRIEFTNIETLEGLNNLRELGHLSLRYNFELYNIDVLINATIVASNQHIEISNNLSLANCSISFICDLLNQYGDIQIFSNSGQCESVIQLRGNCGLEQEIVHNNIIFQSGFELWENDAPLDWSINPAVTIPNYNILTYEKSSALTEGDHAIILRGETLQYDLPSEYKSMDLSFDLRLPNRGIFTILVEELNDITGDKIDRPIFRLKNLQQDSIHSVFLNDITPSTENHSFASIKLKSEDYVIIIISGPAIHFYPNLTLDNFIVSTKQTSKVSEVVDQNFQVCPNPFNEIINIKQKNTNAFVAYIFNSRGDLVMSEQSPNMLNTIELPKGYYIVQIIEDDQTISIPLIKL